MQNEDKILVENFNNGDNDAFNVLMKKHAQNLYLTARSLLNSNEDAEEVVQDAFVKIYKNINSFRWESAFYTWARKIVLNLARNKYHWLKRRGEHAKQSIYCKYNDDENEKVIEFVDESSVDPADNLFQKELEAKVKDVFCQLPPKLKEVMTLRHVDELSYEQIAEVLDCKCGTVKSRIARGREILRKKVSAINSRT